ncbi:hypothetical protein PSTT_14722 [Puccinia striiformis]|uniref:Uncharacterized protein n=1 Tax=Puccinia striiformis TaxID=27350 RepID=A0A2S4UL89_9BASI|nr:hypothetical protein PSTT_14722 [Puccinia striiformis]
MDLKQPYLCDVPNRRPLACADGGNRAGGEGRSIAVNIPFPQTTGFPMRSGRSYALEGEISKLDDQSTPIFHVEHSSEDRELTGPELVELGPVKGYKPTLFACSVISVNDLDVPSNTRFKLGTRIFLTGISWRLAKVKEPSQWSGNG